MKINTAPTDIAQMGGVDSVKEFTIKSTARSFQILSSGLYANKIRAIIRELSCNAYDSHVASGDPTKKFEIHLPTALEPWFAIRDYGVGLDQTQVKNLYTTYFESTKTDSNDYVGALGLGSKSPFSYTDNFTVTAIKNGTKGIYTAFVSPQGVPSVALMSESKTREKAGVEIRLSVDEPHDFYKFAEEANRVFRYFETRPIIKGVSNFTFDELKYIEKDIVPGIHLRDGYRGRTTNAIMGNICYPIDVPNSEKNLGNLAHLLQCGLDIYFPIGALDFQASREGLSYIPQTIEAIKDRLQELQSSLQDTIKKELALIENDWEKLSYLSKKAQISLWYTPVMEYVKTANIPTVEATHRQIYGKRIMLVSADIRDKFNISISAFHNSYGRLSHNRSGQIHHDGKYKEGHELSPDMTVRFIVNDLKTGTITRCREWANANSGSQSIYVLSPSNKELPMDVDGFMALIHSPPASFTLKASGLPKPEKVVAAVEPAQVMSYITGGGWKYAGAIDMYPDTATYYYVNLKGSSLMSDYGVETINQLMDTVRNAGIKLQVNAVYGIRRAAAEGIEGKANWIKFEDHVKQVLSTLPKSFLLDTINAERRHAMRNLTSGTARKIAELVDPASPFVEFAKFDEDAKGTNHRTGYNELQRLLIQFLGNDNSLSELMKTYETLTNTVSKLYPLLKAIDFYGVDNKSVASYINLVDQHQKENV